MKYRIQVNVSTDKDDDTWSGNSVTYPTPEEAMDAAKDLFMRWTLVNYWRVVDETDKVYHTNKHKPEGEADENLATDNSTPSTE
jgi:hypothetical protein